jgi:ACS family glucarate transporter-like MFS transporter
VTPIAIGYIVQLLGSFDWALVFVAAHCMATILAYLLLVRKIERVTLAPAL